MDYRHLLLPGYYLSKLIDAMREIKILREQIKALQTALQKKESAKNTNSDSISDVPKISQKVLTHSKSTQTSSDSETKRYLNLTPIGLLLPCPQIKNGNSSETKAVKGKIVLSKTHSPNFQIAFEKLTNCSYIWIVYPTLNQSTDEIVEENASGITCPIDSRILKVNKIEKGLVHVEGSDISGQTTIFDIIPYIPEYQNFASKTLQQSLKNLEEAKTSSAENNPGPSDCKEIHPNEDHSYSIKEEKVDDVSKRKIVKICIHCEEEFTDAAQYRKHLNEKHLN